MAQVPSLRPDVRMLPGANVRRLMAHMNMTQGDVANVTGLDERTLRSILNGNTQPHAKTLHKLADGLGVSVDDLYQDPCLAGGSAFSASDFDRATNPIVAEVVESHPELFSDWSIGDFNELYSRMAVGGELTEAGTIAASRTMNQRRELMGKVAVILESSESDMMRDLILLMYRRATSID